MSGALTFARGTPLAVAAPRGDRPAGGPEGGWAGSKGGQKSVTSSNNNHYYAPQQPQPQPEQPMPKQTLTIPIVI